MSLGFGFGFSQLAAASGATGGASLSLQFAGSSTLDPRITFTRASSATYFDSAGVLTTAGNNEPRFDFNPITLIPRGLLIEDARTNLLLNSATLSTQSVTVAAVAHTLSFYGTGTVTLSGASTAGPLVGTGVFPNRVSLVFTPTAGTLTLTVTGTVQYAQLEAGEFASSYITTTGAAATRQKDVALLNTVSPWYNASESTLYAEAELPVAQDTANRVLFSLSTTAIGDSAYLFRGSNQNRVFMSVSAGGVSGQFTSAGFVISDNTAFKAAGAIKVNDGALTLNGATPQTDNILTMPASATVAAIGVGSWNTAAPQAFAWFRQIAYYPRRLVNSQLQTITAPTVTASLVASRLSGTAPLAIHLDATGTTSTAVSDPFRQVIYSFDYGDPGSGTWSTDGRSKNTDSGGPLGAHVFETAGTYTVTLTANDGGSTSTTSVNITVNNPDTVYSGTNTICIDPTGGTTGGPAGCQYVTSMPTIISNRRYLIRRGQTIAGFTVPIGVTGVRIGAYGTGARPIVSGAVILNGDGPTPTTSQFVEDIVVSDLDIRDGFDHFMSGRNLMLLRCNLDLIGTNRTVISFGSKLDYWSDAEGTGDPSRVLPRTAFYEPNYIFVVDCYQRGPTDDPLNPAQTGMYVSIDCGAIMGHDSYGSQQHILRPFFARRLLVQHSILADKSSDGFRHAIKLMSGGLNPPLPNYEANIPAGQWYSQQNIIRRNTLGVSDSNNTWTVIIAPQNVGSAEGVQDTIIEDNTFINSASKQVDIQAGPARRTTTRNNTLTGGSIRISQVSNTYVEPIQSQWRGPYYGQYTAAQTLSPSLLTNSSTFYSPTVSSAGNNVAIFAVPNTPFGTSHNRVVSAPAAGEILVFYLAGNNGTTASSMTDSGGGTWTFDVGTATNFGFYRRSGGSTSGSITISWTTSANDVCWGAAFYLSNMNTAAPLDSTAPLSTTGFTTTPSVSITTTANNCIVLGQIYRTGGGTPTLTPTPPAQLYQDATYTSLHILYLVDAGAAGAKTLAGTWSVGSGQERFAVAYKPV